MDAMERARRALVRFPPSSPPAETGVRDVAEATKGAMRAAYLEAVQVASSRVYDGMDVTEAGHRRAESTEIARALEQLAFRVR